MKRTHGEARRRRWLPASKMATKPVFVAGLGSQMISVSAATSQRNVASKVMGALSRVDMPYEASRSWPSAGAIAYYLSFPAGNAQDAMPCHATHCLQQHFSGLTKDNIPLLVGLQRPEGAEEPQTCLPIASSVLLQSLPSLQNNVTVAD
ncbi:hypothetical protein CKAH01_11065 [Colletotrichum kahawae]|uniref:Uncharacterized protein n=1 Tax=Colletotrichum kahawae TaxID=34407 RepID=A0AAD9XXJ2_COLKA|nr:hypothetical protein CKAH01_11065 [Colletotrichum kahawae]